MFDTILVPMCKNTRCGPVMEQAICTAKRERARLRGLYVVDEEDLVPPAGTEGIDAVGWREVIEPELRAAGEAALAELRSQCALAGVPVETTLAVGSIKDVICREAKVLDLIVLGRCGDYTRRPLLVGCSALEGSIRYCDCPTLAVGDRARQVRHALVAYDGGASANAALAMAADLSLEWSVPLTLLTVVEKNTSRDALAQGRAFLQRIGVECRGVLREGAAATEILRLSEEEDVDLIIMGAYCHGRVQELVFGGTVCQVLERSVRPVLVCH